MPTIRSSFSPPQPAKVAILLPETPPVLDRPRAEGTGEGVADAVAVAGVAKRFGGVQALDGVSLAVPRGRITGLIGPNGAGKSTLFNVIAGSERPDQGHVRLEGRDITGIAAHRRAHFGLVRSFQVSRELGRLTVLENMLLARPSQPGEAAWQALLRPAAVRREETKAIERARALLERVNLWRLADDYAGSLSGGQKKLLELVRALMTEARIILLDEPAAGVNPLLIDDIAAFIRSLRAEGITLAITEHNMDMVAALCDRVHVLAEGRVIASGSFAEVTADERVVEAYLGGAT